MSELDTSRGIKNAVARYSDLAKDRLTQTNLLQQNNSGSSDDFNDDIRFSGIRDDFVQRGVQLQKIYRSVYETLQNTELAQDEIEKIAQISDQKPPKVSFPYFIVGISILKDILDVGDILILGIIITTALSFLLSIILFFWTLGKLSGGWYKKAGIGFLWKKLFTSKIWGRFALMVGIEMIPFLKIIPATTIFTLMAYKSETKVVKLIDAALEEIHRMGIR